MLAIETSSQERRLMSKPGTIASYAARITRVIDHIWANLDRAPTLDELAGVAALSPYHFHRVYHAVCDETVAETLRRLRLHRAAGDLVAAQGLASRLPLSRIARRAGYGSLAAFGRAFAAAHGMPPAAFRARGMAPFPRPGLKENHKMPDPDVTISNYPAVHLAALAHRGDYQTIGKSFEKLTVWAFAKGLLSTEPRMIGIYYDDPEATPPAELRAHACVEVGADVKADDEIEIIDLPEARIASLIHKGPYAELPRAYARLYKDWLPSSGEQPGARPCFEEYLNSPRSLPPSEWLTRVCMPLA
jgi:AraC family transcriptional regulator